MGKTMGKFAVAIALLLGVTVCAASPASAQTRRFNVFGGYSYGTNNFSNGLYFLSPFGTQALNGYSAAFTVNFNNHIGMEANFSGHKGTSTILNEPPIASTNGILITSDQNVYTYAFGPKLFQTVGNFSLFTHFLVGGVHLNQTLTETCTPGTGSSCSPASAATTEKGTGFAFMTGGGVDWNHGRWGIRILEVDYVHGQMVGAFSGSGAPVIPLTSLATSGNNFQLATGLIFNFGKSE